MKKINRKISLFESRILSLLIAAVMLLTSINLVNLMSASSAGYSNSLTALADELFDDGTIVRSDALHFYVRHWHTQEDTDARLQGNQAGQGENTKNYFVIAEGYIMPNEATADYPFSIYFVGQDNGDNTKEMIPITDTSRYDESYVKSYDLQKGSITLSTKVLVNAAGSALERFSGFSISAGRDAVAYNNAQAGTEEASSITITYSEYVHLVKGHIFYVRASKVVSGSDDENLGYTDEIDTAEVYTYKNSEGEHKAGDIVLTSEGKACETLEEVKAVGLTEDDVELTKFYSTMAGLHTDNALLVQDTNGRVYQFDLAAWYVQGVASQVGLVLDSSGGFGYAYDYPDPINVYDVLGDDKANELLEDKIDGIENAKKNPYNYPKRKDLIGYYEITNNSSGNNRRWYYNSIVDNEIDDGVRQYFAPSTNYEQYGTDQYFAKAVYLSEESINLSGAAPVIQYSDYTDVDGINSSSGWSNWASFSTNDGLSLGGQIAGDTGFMLSDLSTPTEDFTLSFKTTYISWPDDNDIEILYIGGASSLISDAEFRLVREHENNSLVLYHKGTPTTLIENYSPFATRQTITFTYDGADAVKFYVDGDLIKTVDGVTFAEKEYIVFNPFDDGVKMGGSNAFNVDEIIVYDTELSKNEVSQLISALGDYATTRQDMNAKVGMNWNAVFLTDSELELILNPRNTDRSLNGWSGYNYFVYSGSVKEFVALAYWDGSEISGSNNTLKDADRNVIAGKSTNAIANGRGWYYINSTNLTVAKAENTAKQVYGMNTGGAYYDRTDNYSEGGFSSGVSIHYDEYDWEPGKDTQATYNATNSGAAKFYIDNNGNLRCFFNSSNNAQGCSYVYELPDDKYVKTEAMQRILGNFATMLIDRSPATEVSAVQFHAEATGDDQKELVLLDWSNDANDIAGLMSMKYGKGGFNDHEPSANNVDQYNYALTGGSYIYSALQSFQNILMPHHNEKAERFLIIITDGADSGEEKTKTEAARLREAGYTIISVMFGGTTFNEVDNPDEYKDTYNHMKDIAGKEGMTDKEKEKYIFSSDNLEGLMDLFSESILDTIADALDGYTVKNYIDPRFDVVGSDGTDYILGAGGKVEIYSVSETSDIESPVYLSKTEGVTVNLAGTTDSNALTPSLYYDSSKDMYYLEWTDQVIPTSAEGAPLLGVWSAQITLKAKDDFIGGNAVLTNGNEAGMNYLFDKNDPDSDNPTKLSGTDKMNAEKYPSKGFPRTTVNVQLKPLETTNLDGVLYNGEVISSAQLLTDIEYKYVTSTYYLEYLRRFAYQRYLYFLEPEHQGELGEGADIDSELNMPLLNLLNKWLGLDTDNTEDNTQDLKQFSVRYMYLPSVDYDESGKIEIDPDTKLGTPTNNAGNLGSDGKFDMNTADVLGILTYRWQKLDDDGVATHLGDKDYVIHDSNKTAYSITVEFTPLQVGDTVDSLNNIADKESTIAQRSYSTYGTYMFAGRIIFRSPDAHKEGWTTATNKDLKENFVFDRKAIINNSYIKDKGVDGKNVYEWDPEYRPALQDPVQIKADTEEDKKQYGTVETANSGRTLVAESVYEQEIVSGGVALEMKLLIGELERLLENGKYTFTVEATRKFTDTDWAQTLKTNEKLDDYGNDFKITFEINKADLNMEELKKAAEDDKFGYVTIFAKTTNIVGTFGKDDNFPMKGLPIGTYTFTLDGANNVELNSKIKFASISSETDPNKFSEKYFDKEVVLDLTENEETGKKDKAKTHLEDPTITNFIAESKTNDEKTEATFYIGTSTSNERGNVEYDTKEARYTDARLGIVVLSTGTVKLTIKEDGGQNNESFLYRITGKTLGYKDIELVVSVKGGASTTINILAGEYTITEISDWSWKYNNKDTVENDNCWTIDENLITAEINLKDIEENYTVQEHVVTYYHESKNLPWLGEEGFYDGYFE